VLHKLWSKNEVLSISCESWLCSRHREEIFLSSHVHCNI